MDNSPFFKDENKDLLYNLCRDEIYKQNQYNIDQNRKYYKTFGEIMKIVHKHSKNVHDLTNLNKEVLAKTIPYLQKEIEKKNLRNSALLPPNVLRNQNLQGTTSLLDRIPASNKALPVSFRSEATNMAHEKLASVNSNYEDIINSRDSLLAKPAPPDVNFSKNSDDNYESANLLMEKNLQLRQETNQQFNIPDNSNQNSNLPNQFIPNVNQGIDNNQFIPSIQNQEPNRNSGSQGVLRSQDSGFSNTPNMQNVKMSVQDFTLSDDTVKNLHQGQEGSNLIRDMNTYSEENNNIDPKVLLKQYQDNNSKQDEDFLQEYNKRMEFEASQKEANLNLELGEQQRQLENDLKEHTFKESLSFKMNQDMEQENVPELRGQFDHRIQQLDRDIQPIMADDTKALQTNTVYEENKLFQILKDKLFKERKYVNKENLVIINSADRDWFNETDENRYSFQVRFNPDAESVSAGIQTIFKNIVSFELVRVLMPIENFIIPFDNRMFVDYKSLPYIVLKIDEIEGLYGGTNANTNKAFAQLLWDKDFSTDIVSDTAATTLTNTQKFPRIVKRGFSSMAPMSFEKKTFYPTPLSSLNRLTMALESPYGKSILNHPDVLKIKNITYINFKTAGLVDYVGLAQNPVNNTDLTLITGNLPYATKLTFTPSGSFGSAKNFEITGKKSDGTDATEILAVDSTVATTVQTYVKITKIESKFDQSTHTVKVGIEKKDLALMDTDGLPYSNSQMLIEIETFSYFNNRVFKIGDIIKIQGFVDESSDTFTNNSYINREEGHHIINLELESNGITSGENEGFIQKIYISPPAELDFTSESADSIVKTGTTTSVSATTILFKDTDSSDTTKNCKLINKSIQTHFSFKIVTREEDIHSHMVSSNV